MSTNGKGSRRRPAAVDRKAFEDAWERTFGGRDREPDQPWTLSEMLTYERAVGRALAKRAADYVEDV